MHASNIMGQCHDTSNTFHDILLLSAGGDPDKGGAVGAKTSSRCHRGMSFFQQLFTERHIVQARPTDIDKQVEA